MGITRLPSLILYCVGGISLKSSASRKSSVGSTVIEPAVTELSSIFIPLALSQPWCKETSKHFVVKQKENQTSHLELVHSPINYSFRLPFTNTNNRKIGPDAQIQILSKCFGESEGQIKRAAPGCVLRLLKSFHLLTEPPRRAQCGGLPRSPTPRCF